MKRIIINLVVIVFFTLLSTTAVLASAPPPPPPGGPGTGELPIGGSAPVGSGLVILLSMGAAYGAKKVYQLRKKEEE